MNGVIVVRRSGVSMVVVDGGRRRIFMPVIAMGRGQGLVVMNGYGRRRLVVVRVIVVGRSYGGGVMAVRLGGRSGGEVVVTVSGFVAVIAVRLLLVAHSASIPQPLSAVFAAKSV